MAWWPKVEVLSSSSLNANGFSEQQEGSNLVIQLSPGKYEENKWASIVVIDFCSRGKEAELKRQR